MNIYAFSALVAFVTTVGIGLAVYLVGKRKPLNRLFGVVISAVSLWVLGCFGESYVISTSSALFWDKLLYTGAPFAPILCVHFALVIAERIKEKKKILTIAYLLSISFVIFNLVPALRPLFIQDVTRKFPFRFIAVPGPLWYFFLVFYGSFSFYGFFELVRKYQKSTGITRNQIKYFLISFMTLFAGGVMYFSLVFNVVTPPIDNLFTIAFGVIMAYAIVTYRLMDITVVVTRGGVVVGTYAFIIGVPALVASVGRLWLVAIMGRLWWVPPLGLFAGLALVGPFVALFLIRKLEAKQRERELKAEEHLERTAQGMIEIDSVDKLVKLIPRYLTKFYYAHLDVVITHATIFLDDKDRREYVLKSTAGIRRISLDRALPEEENPFYVWFKKIIPLIIENRFVKRRELDVLQREDIDFWLKEERLLRLGDYIKPSLMELKELMVELRAVLCVPSFYQEGLLGFLILGEKEKGLFSARELALFFRLARYAALAIRSAQLSQDLRKAQAAVAQQDRLSSMGQLAASFAHEINNPVAIIIAGIELSLRAMREDLVKASSLEEKEKVVKYAEDKLEKIKDEAFRVSRIIGRIMGYVRASTDDFTSLSLNDLVEASLGLVEHPLRQKQIEVVKEIPEDLPQIRGIAGELQEVFLNLFNNAIEAMEGMTAGSIKILASTLGSNPEMVEVKVSDTGCGIPHENLRKVFDFLFTTKLRGTGVGLSVVYDTIKKHDGTIGVESEVGKGTSFTIRLPVWK